jgi:hypothetical protein
MSFLHGKRDEFEKDANTLRETYRVGASSHSLKKTKMLPKPLFLTPVHITDFYLQHGDICFIPQKQINDFVEYFFEELNITESFCVGGDAIYKNDDVTQISFVEYFFFEYPYTGGIPESYNQKGDVIFTTEVVE